MCPLAWSISVAIPEITTLPVWCPRVPGFEEAAPSGPGDAGGHGGGGLPGNRWIRGGTPSSYQPDGERGINRRARGQGPWVGAETRDNYAYTYQGGVVAHRKSDGGHRTIAKHAAPLEAT